jgi:hypothetical protein
MAGTDKQREEINRKLVSMQMEMIGKTYDDAMDTPEFWRVYTLTTEQTEEWRKKAIPLIKKTFKVNATKAKTIMSAFELSLGLRIDDNYYEEVVIPTTSTTTTLVFKPIKKKVELTFWQKVKKFFIGYV